MSTSRQPTGIPPCAVEIVTVRCRGDDLHAAPELLAGLQHEVVPGSHLRRRAGGLLRSTTGRSATLVRAAAPDHDLPPGEAVVFVDGLAVGPHGHVPNGRYLDTVKYPSWSDPERFLRSHRGVYLWARCETDGTALLAGDPLGTYPVYYYDTSGLFVASNNALLIEQVLRAAGRSPGRTAAPFAEDLLLGSAVQDQTGIEGVRLAPMGCTVGSGGNRPGGYHEVIGSLERYSTPEPIASVLDRAADEIKENVRALAEGPFDERVCDLTGGADSRVVLAAILDQGLEGEFAFHCIGDHPSPDYSASAYLQDALGLDEVSRPEAQDLIATQPRDWMRAFLHRTMGGLGEPVALGIGAPVTPGRLRLGGGMSGYKGVYTADNPRPSLLEATERLCGHQRARRRRGVTGEFARSLEARVRDLLESRREAGFDMGAALDQWYVEHRTRSHFGLSTRAHNLQQPVFHALYSPAALEAAMSLPTTQRAGNHIGIGLLERLYEPLIAVPLADDRWHPRAVSDHPDRDLIARLRPFTSTSPLVSPSPGRRRHISPNGGTNATSESTWAQAARQRGRPPWWLGFEHVLPVARSFLREQSPAELWETFDKPMVEQVLDQPLSAQRRGADIKLIYRALLAAMWLQREELSVPAGLPAPNATSSTLVTTTTHTAPRVTAVVLNFGHWEDTATCVARFREAEVTPTEIEVVDNPTPEQRGRDVIERRRHVPDSLDACRLTFAPSNLGYAGGNNLAVSRALQGGSEFVWLVNPDCEVAPDTLRQLLETARHVPDAGVLGPRILLGRRDDPPPRRIWFDGGQIDWEDGVAARHIHQGRRAERTHPVVRDVDFVTGACLLVRTSLLRAVGSLPEDYFLYFEETDLCTRALRAGFRVIVDQRATAYHDKRSSGQLPEPYFIYYYTRSRLLFASRFTPGREVEVAAHLRAGWLATWRRRVERAAPEWLTTFDELAESGIADGCSGRTGRHPGIEFVPRPTSGGTEGEPEARG